MMMSIDTFTPSATSDNKTTPGEGVASLEISGLSCGGARGQQDRRQLPAELVVREWTGKERRSARQYLERTG